MILNQHRSLNIESPNVEIILSLQSTTSYHLERTDSSRGGPFLFFLYYFLSFQERISYHTSSERSYFTVPIDVKHNGTKYDPPKMCPKTPFFIFYFFNTHISVTGKCAF